MPAIPFYILSAITAGCALGAVANRNTVTAAFCLLGSLLGISGLFVLLDAYLLAALLVLVYAGAIVALDLRQSVTVTPTEAGATVSPTGSVKALYGLYSSERGIVATYGAQLLFAVPSVDSTAPIVLLGYSQGLVSAGQIP